MEKSLYNAFLLCTVVGMLVAVLLALSHLIFAYVPSDEKMIEVATGYLYFVSLSLPATVIYNVLRSYAEGLGYTKPTMYFGILMLVFRYSSKLHFYLWQIWHASNGWCQAVALLAVLSISYVQSYCMCISKKVSSLRAFKPKDIHHHVLITNY